MKHVKTSISSKIHDRFAVAVLQGDSAVGYMPRESSKVAWYFLRHGGDHLRNHWQTKVGC